MYDTQQLLPWLETATYISEGGSAGGDVSVSVYDAAKYPLSLREVAASAGAYTSNDFGVTVPAQVLTDGLVDPKPGDRITFGSTTLTVLEVSGSPSYLEFWKFTCRNLSLVYGLRSTLAVRRSTNTLDSTGKRTATFTEAYSGVQCRVQEQTDQVDPMYRDGHHLRKRYMVYVGQRLTLLPGDVLRVDGVDYDFDGASNWDRLDRLGEVSVTRVV